MVGKKSLILSLLINSLGFDHSPPLVYWISPPMLKGLAPLGELSRGSPLYIKSLYLFASINQYFCVSKRTIQIYLGIWINPPSLNFLSV